MVSARSEKIDPRLSLEEESSPVFKSHEWMIPDVGEASGRRADCLAKAEFKGFKLLLRKVLWNCPNGCGLPRTNPLTPYVWGNRQISLSLATPGGQRF